MEQSTVPDVVDSQIDQSDARLDEFATSEYNTAELSDLTGLSKILRADDSIADRVRCLLEEDGEDLEHQPKPELLRSADGNASANNEIKGKIISLLQEDRELERPRTAVSETPISADDPDPVDTQADEEWKVSEVEVHTPLLATSGRRSGDGADFEPPPSPQESSDDIMNISDSTEYSDLPKVVDNPIKGSRTDITSASHPIMSDNGQKSTSKGDESTALSDGSKANIVAEAVFYAASDPNTPQSVDYPEQICNLERYVVSKNQFPASRKSQNEEHENPVAGPMHSTPCFRSSSDTRLHQKVSRVSQSPVPGKPNMTEDRRRSQEGNITIRSRDSSKNIPIQNGASPACSSKSRHHIPNDLGDEALLEKVRKAVSETEQKSSGLQGPHTASENSIASTVDSLAMQVKNLLKEDERESQPLSAAVDLSDININEVSHNSNYSDEITNFERTSLWKYTRQFLPGAMTPSREIQPLAQFSESSLIHAKEITSGSSNISSPETYRLAMQNTSPRCNAPARSLRNASGYVREPENALSYLQENSRSRSSTRDSNLSAGSHQGYSYKRDMPATSKSPSRIVGRYDSYPRPSNFTPQNESYKALEPEYSQTPYTPYDFMTPRKVAWEAEKDSVVKYKSPIQRARTPQISSSTPTTASLAIKNSTSQSHPPKSPIQEKSAYFNQPTDVQKSPKVIERSSGVRFHRSTPDLTDSIRKPNIPQKDKFTSTKDYLMNASENHIFVKSVTPPSRNLSTRKEFAEHKTKPASLSEPPESPRQIARSSPKSVHFREAPSSLLRSRKTPFKGSKSPLNPEYSFTTPMLSSRPPERNITPKVVKERPRLSKPLPTFDQLLAEREKSEEVQPVPENKHPAEENPHPKEKQKDLITKPVKSTTGFSALKPEICLHDSDGEDLALRRKCDGDRSLSLSDSDLHRRTTKSGESCESDAEKLSHSASQAAVPKMWGLRTSEEEKTGAYSDTTSPPPTPTEPAPLPYVRLCKKQAMPLKAKTPPGHSISTEKVQNLLMKEKTVNRKTVKSRNTGCSASLPVKNGELSTDEELLNLLETFSVKVPVMEKLLKKLYDRNLEKQPVIDPEPQVPIQLDEQRRKIDKSIQTSRKSPAVNRAKPKVLYARKPNQRKLFTETSCQTSFVKSSKQAFASKGTSPMEEYFSESDSDFSDETPENHIGTNIKETRRENKENSFRKSQPPCAFFVDLTPEKLSKEQYEEKIKHPPVAWYEPYEYMHPWRQRDSQPRTTLGFVDANIQDAFLDKKRDFVLRSWERQEDIAIRAEERKLKELERRIHDQIVALHKEKADGAAKSSALAPPKIKGKKELVFGWKEMRIASKLKYDALPEVVAKKREAERKESYELNRRRAQFYKERITQSVVQKQNKRKLASEVR